MQLQVLGIIILCCACAAHAADFEWVVAGGTEGIALASNDVEALHIVGGDLVSESEVARFTKIIHLRISKTSIRGKWLDHFLSTGKLQTFSVARCDGLGEQTFELLARNEGLRNLDIDNTLAFLHGQPDRLIDVTDQAMARLNGLKQITHVRLHGCYDLTDTAFTNWGSLSAIRVLDVTNCSKLDGDVFAETRLRELHAWGSFRSGRAVIALMNHGTLKTLKWGDLWQGSKHARIDIGSLDGFAAALIKCREMQILELPSCNSDAATVATCAKLESLKRLDLSDIPDRQGRPDSRAYGTLAGLREIEHLNLSGTLASFADIDADIFGWREALVSLDLTSCPEVSNNLLGFLSECRALSSLKLIGCAKLDPEGLIALKNAPALHTVHVSRWKHDLSDAIARLQQLRPRLQIISD